jgi:hypothetical protein
MGKPSERPLRVVNKRGPGAVRPPAKRKAAVIKRTVGVRSLFAIYHEAGECHRVHSCGGDDLKDEIRHTIEVVGLGEPDELRWETREFRVSFDDPFAGYQPGKRISRHVWAFYSDGTSQYLGDDEGMFDEFVKIRASGAQYVLRCVDVDITAPRKQNPP